VDGAHTVSAMPLDELTEYRLQLDSNSDLSPFIVGRQGLQLAEVTLLSSEVMC